MFEHHKKESPILSLAGVGGGPSSYIFYSASGGGTYEVSRSLRFNSSESPYLSKTPSQGNRKTFTWAGWVKKSTITSNTTFFSAGSDGNNRSHFMFDGTTHSLRFFDLPTSTGVITTQHLKDVGAWYHLVLVVDTTQSTPADRVKFYINGRKVTEFTSSPTYPGQNDNMQMTSAVEHRIGSGIAYGEYFNGYIADVHLVDGTAIGDTNGVIDEFGEFDSYNVWQPKSYSGSHGTAGFHLTFTDTSSNSALGTDSSSSNNNFAVTNLHASTGGAPSGKTLTRFRTKTDWNWHRIAAVKINGTLLTTGTLDNSGSVWTNPDEWKDGNANSSNYTGSTSARGDWFDVTLATNIDNFANFELYMQLDSSAGSTTNVYEVELFFSDGTSFLRQYASNSDAPNQANYQFNSWQWQNFGDLGTVTPANVDVMRDSPQNVTSDSENEIGNYATLNSYLKHNSSDVLSNGNLKCVPSGGSAGATPSTMSFSSGKFFYETTWVSNGQNGFAGIRKVGSINYDNSYHYNASNGQKYINGSADASFGDTFTNGDVITTAVDMDNGFLTFYKNGVMQSNGHAFSSISGDYTFFQGIFGGSGTEYSVNFGQQPFKYPINQSMLMFGPKSASPYNIERAFDGNTSTYADHNGAGTTLTWKSIQTDVTSLRVYIHQGSSTGTVTTVGANGTQVDTIATDFGPGWHTISLASTGSTINSIAFTRGGSGAFLSIYAIEVNGTIITDSTKQTTYKTLCSTNLTPPIVDSSTAFDIDLYDGTGAALSRSNFSFSPEFLWIKQRSQDSTSHALFDVCRGGSKRLQSNERNAEVDVDQYGGGVTSFDDDGFTLGTWTAINANTENYVAWAWEAGGVPTTDNVASAGQVPTAGSAKVNGTNLTTAHAGTIQITRMSVNTTTGFSIVTFENPNSQETLGHGLGKTPEMIWVKSRDTGGNSNPWQVYHKGIGNNVKLYLDGTDSTVSSSVWGTTDPTSTVFTLNDNVADSWVAYSWTSIEGYSFFGSYEGGTPFIQCGFQPKWVMVKNADRSGEEWIILDRARDPSNVAGHTMYADSPTYEVDYRAGGNARSVSFLSNGFKVNGGNPLSQSGTHIFAAFAEHPMSSARAR